MQHMVSLLSTYVFSPLLVACLDVSMGTVAGWSGVDIPLFISTWASLALRVAIASSTHLNV
jgi:hypothetical protein